MRLRGVGVAVLALAAVGLAGCKTTGIVRTPTPLAELEHPQLQIEKLWSAHIGDGSGGLFSGLRIAVAEDAVFTGSVDGEAEAFDPATGKRIWRVDTKARLISGPTLDGPQVLFGTLDAEVIALDRATGKQLWVGKASSEVLAPPVGDQRVVVVRSVDGRVYGLNASDGQRLWSFSRAEPRLTLRGQSAPLLVGGNVLIGQDDGTVNALDVMTGKVLWQQAIAIPTGRSELARMADIDADLLPSAGGIYVVSYGDTVALINPDRGEISWKRSVRAWAGMALAPGGNTLYVSADDGDIWALDAATGAQAWRVESLHYRMPSSLAVNGDTIVAGDFQGYLHWLSPQDGRMAGRVRLGGDAIVAAPVAVGDIVYAMDVAGHLAAYKVKAAAGG
ncbi:MAG: outer membrane protein assembly factor BamB [Nevskiaceae bacterium]|nr:MAG: outer membrane protein assembly factor BamB [Nevskiaceae bacterium]TBR73667.1 MAG: outer membrane protein assembly factor BamB [Nevskiaceae bacterium]